MPAERRLAANGNAYTRAEFLAYYKYFLGSSKWAEASTVVATEHSQPGQASTPMAPNLVPDQDPAGIDATEHGFDDGAIAHAAITDMTPTYEAEPYPSYADYLMD